jgi:hypothetical protein
MDTRVRQFRGQVGARRRADRRQRRERQDVRRVRHQSFDRGEVVGERPGAGGRLAQARRRQGRRRGVQAAGLSGFETNDPAFQRGHLFAGRARVRGRRRWCRIGQNGRTRGRRRHGRRRWRRRVGRDRVTAEHPVNDRDDGGCDQAGGGERHHRPKAESEAPPTPTRRVAGVGEFGGFGQNAH